MTLVAADTGFALRSASALDTSLAPDLSRAKAEAALAASQRGKGTSAAPAGPLHGATAAISEPALRHEPATLIAEWNGCVTSVHQDFFSAELSGVTGEGVKGESEDAEIPLTDVSQSDRDLLRPGNFFRLCVFYEMRDGRPLRYTQVVFRRLPAYRSVDLIRAQERAGAIHSRLRVE